MFLRTSTFGLPVCVVLLVCTAAAGQPSISLVPVGNHPDGTLDSGVTIVGNEIRMLGGGRNVFLEVRLGDWDPNDTGVGLKAYQFFVDAGGYSNEFAGQLQRNSTIACGLDIECVSVFGTSSTCSDPAGCGTDCHCAGGFIDETRADFVMADVPAICSTDLATVDTRAACAIIVLPASDPEPFPTGGLYAGTVVVHVPVTARGSFTIDLRPFDSLLVDENGEFIEPLTLGSAVVTIDIPDTNRYLPLTGDITGASRAARVTFSDLPAPFDTLNGKSMWVAVPFEISESSGSAEPDVPGFDNFYVATLQCQPSFIDWAPFGVVQVYHDDIIPGASYTIEYFDEGDPPTLAADVAPLVLRTSRWGDVVGPYDPVGGFWTPPDGRVDVPTDVLAMVQTFVSSPGFPRKVRIDLEPAFPDGRVFISDIMWGVSAFQGLPYPFEPNPFPCE